MNGEIAQFWKVGIVEGLLAKRRVADNQVKPCPLQFYILKAAIEVTSFRVKILGNGRRGRVKLYSQEVGIIALWQQTHEVADASRRLQHS